MTRDNLPSDLPTNRREFIQGVGVTFAVGATGIVGACTMETGGEATGAASAPINEAISPNAWVSIGADDVITIQFGGTEMGQGTMTSLPLVLAEELDADWENVRVETVATHDPTYGNPRAFGYYGFPILYTAGSQTLRGYFTAMRQAGAQARKFLIEAAAAEWGVPAEDVQTEPSRVVHRQTGRSLSYGEIAAFAEVPETLPEVDESSFKPASEFRYLGTDVGRIDVPAKTDGSAKFGIDAQVPGMVYASILRTPVEGERPMEVGDSAARAIDGVTDVVILPYGVAVVANTVEASMWGKQALDVTWSETSRFREVEQNRDLDEYESRVRDLSFDTGNEPPREVGNIDAAFAEASQVIEAVYRVDPAYHAPDGTDERDRECIGGRQIGGDLGQHADAELDRHGCRRCPGNHHGPNRAAPDVYRRRLRSPGRVSPEVHRRRVVRITGDRQAGQGHLEPRGRCERRRLSTAQRAVSAGRAGCGRAGDRRSAADRHMHRAGVHERATLGHDDGRRQDVPACPWAVRRWGVMPSRISVPST